MNGAPPLLQVENLEIEFHTLKGVEPQRVQAVRGVSFSVDRGEVLGLVGESGSGKSVSTQAIPGLLPPSAKVTGSIRFAGAELLGSAKLQAYRGRKIGMIFQEPGRSFDPLQNLRSVFLETLRNDDPRISKSDGAKKAAALLREAGLERAEERLSNFPHQFSGGQLQRIGIALALAQSCELLVADEPTTALDVTIQRQIVELLKSLQKSRELAIIFISHDIDLVAELAHRFVVMYGGLVMESASAETILTGARHPYTKALLDASPALGAHYTKDRLLSIPGRVTDPARPEPGCPFAPRCPEAAEECRTHIPALKSAGPEHEARCVFL